VGTSGLFHVAALLKGSAAAATAVVVVVAAVVAAAAAAYAPTAAAEQDKNHNDDPPAVVTTKTVHKQFTSQNFDLLYTMNCPPGWLLPIMFATLPLHLLQFWGKITEYNSETISVCRTNTPSCGRGG